MAAPVTKRTITRLEAEKQPYLGVTNPQGRYEKVIFPSDLEVGLGGTPAALTLGGELNVSYAELDLRGKSVGSVGQDDVLVSIIHDEAVEVKLPSPQKIGKYLTVKDGSYNAGDETKTITITTYDEGRKTTIDGSERVYITGNGSALTFISTTFGWTQIGSSAPSLGLSPSVTSVVYTDPQGQVVPDVIGFEGANGLTLGIESPEPAALFTVMATSTVTKRLVIQPDFSIIADRRGTSFYGDVSFQKGLSGSLQSLSSGLPYLVAGDHINILTNSLGQVQISASPWEDPDDGYAPISAPYLLASENPSFPNAITLLAGDGIFLGLSGSHLTISSSISLQTVDQISNQVSQTSQQLQQILQAPILTLQPSPDLSGSAALTAGAGILLTQTGSSYVISVTSPSVTGIRTGVALTGSNDVYTTPDKFSYSPGSLGISVYVNGVRQYENFDFTVSESIPSSGYDTVTFNYGSIPPDLSRVLADYVIDTAPGTASRMRSNIVPVGGIDGVNCSFALPNGEKFAVIQDLLSVDVYLNGVRQFLGEDYDISATPGVGYDTFTMKKAPLPMEKLVIDYVLPG